MPKPRVKREEIAIQNDFVTVGRVLAAFGIHGEVKVEVLTDFPQRFAPQSQVLIQGSPMTIERSRWHKGNMLVKLAGVDNRERAEELKEVGIEITPQQAPSLPEDHYYHFQVIGLEVWTSRGEPLGKIAEVLTTGSNDVYVVNGPRGEILIPAIEDVVVSVDIPRGRMVVEPLKGLL
jgi:16S rRNA processing protein RimM